MSQFEEIDFYSSNQELRRIMDGGVVDRVGIAMEDSPSARQLGITALVPLAFVAPHTQVRTASPISPSTNTRQEAPARLPALLNVTVANGTTLDGLSAVYASEQGISVAAAENQLLADNNDSNPLMHGTSITLPGTMSSEAVNSTANGVVTMYSGDTIWHEAEEISPTTANELTEQIEHDNNIVNQAEAESTPVGYNLIVPKLYNIKPPVNNSRLTSTPLLKTPKHRVRVAPKLAAKPRVTPKTQPRDVNAEIHRDLDSAATHKPLPTATTIKPPVHLPPVAHHSPKKHRHEIHHPHSNSKPFSFSLSSIFPKLKKPIAKPHYELHSTLKRDSRSTRDYASPIAHVSTTKNHEEPVSSSSYGIESSVLSSSGLSLNQLRHALSQQNGGTMAPLAGAIYKASERSGINALYIASAAAIESDWGTSNFARFRDNFFGFEAYTSNPDAAARFPNYSASIDAFVNLLISDYLTPGGLYYHGPTLHGIYVKYSSAHDEEASSIAETMNSLEALALQVPAKKTDHEKHKAEHHPHKDHKKDHPSKHSLATNWAQDILSILGQ